MSSNSHSIHVLPNNHSTPHWKLRAEEKKQKAKERAVSQKEKTARYHQNARFAFNAMSFGAMTFFVPAAAAEDCKTPSHGSHQCFIYSQNDQKRMLKPSDSTTVGIYCKAEGNCEVPFNLDCQFSSGMGTKVSWFSQTPYFGSEPNPVTTPTQNFTGKVTLSDGGHFSDGRAVMDFKNDSPQTMVLQCSYLGF